MQRAFVTLWLNAMASWLRLMSRPVEIDGQRLDPVEHAVLMALRMAGRSGPPPTLDQLRAAYRRMPALVGLPPSARVTRHPVTAGTRPGMLYRPAVPTDRLLVMLHGGGWMLGDLDTVEPIAAFVAERLGISVLTVEYRLAPEHMFPAGFEDACAAYHWAREQAHSLRVDPEKIAIGGDSAGGNLAAAVAVAEALDGRPGPCATWLLYPALDLAGRPASAELFGEGFRLTREMAEQCIRAYAPDGFDRTDPRLSPLRAPEDALRRLGPSVVVTAGFDPLRDQGRAWAAVLAPLGTPVEHVAEPGLAHGFADFAGAVPAARRGLERATDALGRAFDHSRTQGAAKSPGAKSPGPVGEPVPA